MNPARRVPLYSANAFGFAAAVLVGLMSQNASAQVDIERYATGPTLPESVLQKAKVSEEPRYYLDTIDSLNRSTGDLTRTAPGLAKNNYLTKTFVIKNTEAIEIQSYLLRSLAYEGGIAEVMGADGVAGPEGGDAQYLIVTAPDFMMPGITETVELCDRSGFKFFDATGKDFGGGAGAVKYVGKHRTASELTAILSGTELGNVGAFLFPPFADDSTNSIYIVENPTDIADDLLALEMFDVPPLQIEIEIQIMELSKKNAGKLGIDFDIWKRFTTGSFDYSGVDGRGFFQSSTNLYSTLLSLDARALADFLHFTVQTGTTEILTTTKVTMVNSEDLPGGLSGGARGSSTGTPAVIEAVTYIPYPSVQADIGPTNSTNARNELIDAVWEGVRLEILPFIASESTTLQVNASVNSLVGFSKETDTPIVSTRNISSVVNLVDGEPLIIGGLTKQNTVTSRVGLPFLKDIPVVGYLFGKETKQTDQSQVIISLVPKLKNSSVAEVPVLSLPPKPDMM